MPTSLYVHIPFCKSKCSFCSFVVAIEKQKSVDDYLDSLDWEASRHRGTAIETVYFGGGTPTFLSLAQLERLVKIVRDHFQLKTDAEWTIEANPENIDLDKAKLLKSLGVNRVSLGVQSLNDHYLKFLKRNHDAKKALTAYKTLRQAGFQNISLDLMFAFPQQTPEESVVDVEAIVDLKSEHLSLYSLTIEEGTRFHKEQVRLDSGEDQTRHYERVMMILESRRFRQYEISNFAKEGFESRHNTVYWTGGNYIGLGIGAHSHQEGARCWNTANLTTYLDNARKNLSPMEGQEQLDLQKRFIETMLFGLRMTNGIDVNVLEARFGCLLPGLQKEKMDEFIHQGFLENDGGRIKTTLRGRLVLDDICSRLI